MININMEEQKQLYLQFNSTGLSYQLQKTGYLCCITGMLGLMNIVVL